MSKVFNVLFETFIQWTLEQHRIKLQVHLYLGYFSINIQSVFNIPGFCNLHFQPVMNGAVLYICSLDSTNVEAQMYVLFYSILHKGLEHVWILVSTEILEPIPTGYQGMTVAKFGMSQK